MARIQDREATIKTAIIEIKALTVGGRQVTQALFKQLEEERLIDEDTLLLKGVPWGRVNYHAGCLPDTGDHCHVVWQWDDQLRRSCIARRRGEEVAGNRAGYDLPWRMTAFLLSCVDEEPTLRGKPVRVGYETSGRLEVNGLAIEADWRIVPALRTYWEHGHRGRGDHLFEAVAKAFQQYPFSARSDWKEHDADECMGFCRSIAAQRREIIERWGELYRTIEQLDQLFIAV
jgi:hypothetical protein